MMLYPDSLFNQVNDSSFSLVSTCLSLVLSKRGELTVYFKPNNSNSNIPVVYLNNKAQVVYHSGVMQFITQRTGYFQIGLELSEDNEDNEPIEISENKQVNTPSQILQFLSINPERIESWINLPKSVSIPDSLRPKTIEAFKTLIENVLEHSQEVIYSQPVSLNSQIFIASFKTEEPEQSFIKYDCSNQIWSNGARKTGLSLYQVNN